MFCHLRNEGGFQPDLDILSLLIEEAYLKAYPDERRCRAFLQFCADGDVEAIVDLLRDDGSDDSDPHHDDEMALETEPVGEDCRNAAEVLRYQDALGNMESGLHIAVKNEQVEVAWLLLWLASRLLTSEFPGPVIQSAQNARLPRGEQNGTADIRSLKDSDELSAEDYAMQIGGVWNEWVDSGRLKV